MFNIKKAEKNPLYPLWIFLLIVLLFLLLFQCEKEDNIIPHDNTENITKTNEFTSFCELQSEHTRYGFNAPLLRLDSCKYYYKFDNTANYKQAINLVPPEQLDSVWKSKGITLNTMSGTELSPANMKMQVGLDSAWLFSGIQLEAIYQQGLSFFEIGNASSLLYGEWKVMKASVYHPASGDVMDFNFYEDQTTFLQLLIGAVGNGMSHFNFQSGITIDSWTGIWDLTNSDFTTNILFTLHPVEFNPYTWGSVLEHSTSDNAMYIRKVEFNFDITGGPWTYVYWYILEKQN